MTPPPPAAAPYGGGYGSPTTAPVSGLFRKSLGGAVTLVVFSALGVLSPFLPYISVFDESINGWDSREVFSDYDEFSASPVLILLGSIVTLVLGIVVINNQNQGKATSKAGVGVTTLIAGLVTLGSAGMAYNSWDEILYYEDVLANQGIGLWLGVVCGLAATIIGIVALAVPKVTQGVQ
jgi:hypothetical protein